mgnify:FL=1|jgi:DNA-binding NarL/FixJ family response regulator
MAVVVYLPQKVEMGVELLLIVQKAIPDQKIETFSSIDQLIDRIQRPLLDISVAVLHVSKRADLMELIFLKDVLVELEIVLVLAGSQPDVLEKAYELQPRFIVSSESDLHQLGDVLRKMADRYLKTH